MRHRTGTLFGARYHDPNVQIFSLGRGQLPTGEGAAAYLHLRVAVTNTASRGIMRVDPREQVLWVAKRAIPAAFADSDGKPGILQVPPHRHAHLDLFYRITADIEDAVFGWQVWDAEGKSQAQRLMLQALQAPNARAQTALWVPKGQSEQSYKIKVVDRWAEPTNNWYWWREADFPAWPSGSVRIGPDVVASSPWMPQATWYWFDDPYVELWPNSPPLAGGGGPGSARAASGAGSVPLRRGHSGWRRALRAPPSPAPTFGSNTRSPAAVASEGNESSSSSTTTSSPTSQPAPPMESTSSSVGQSWRDKGR